MFAYEPMSEQDAMKARFMLLPDGEYHAVIEKAQARLSNVGNNMIEINLSVYDENGKPNPITDFWVFTPKMMWKVIHGTDSAGLSQEYAEGKFHPDMLIGRNVCVILGTQIGNEIPIDKLNGKPIGSRYPDRNVVQDYVKKEDQKAVSKPVDDFLDDEKIPF